MFHISPTPLSSCQCCLPYILHTSFWRLFVLQLEQCSNIRHLELLSMTVTQIMITTKATGVAKQKIQQTWFNLWPQISAQQRPDTWHCLFSDQLNVVNFTLHFTNLANNGCEIYGCRERGTHSSHPGGEKKAYASCKSLESITQMIWPIGFGLASQKSVKVTTHILRPVTQLKTYKCSYKYLQCISLMPFFEFWTWPFLYFGFPTKMKMEGNAFGSF